MIIYDHHFSHQEVIVWAQINHLLTIFSHIIKAQIDLIIRPLSKCMPAHIHSDLAASVSPAVVSVKTQDHFFTLNRATAISELNST